MKKLRLMSVQSQLLKAALMRNRFSKAATGYGWRRAFERSVYSAFNSRNPPSSRILIWRFAPP